MKVFELYSQRQAKKEKSGKPDVYQYDHMSSKLANQIVLILNDAIGPYVKQRSGFYSDIYNDKPAANNGTWDWIRDTLAREYGDIGLKSYQGKELCNRILIHDHEINKALDVIELCCTWLSRAGVTLSEYEQHTYGISLDADKAIAEINYRMREDGFGFQVDDGKLIRVDSEYIHEEVVKKAISLLRDNDYSGAEDEFIDAHRHYRQGEYKDTTVSLLNSFESTLKTICYKRGWEYQSGATASNLIGLVRAKGLFPEYLDKSFDQLLAVLKSGIPTIRNNEGGHGQGGTPKETPVHVASFALHLAASCIVFLVECETSM